jgi:hypothetical protein
VSVSAGICKGGEVGEEEEKGAAECEEEAKA